MVRSGKGLFSRTSEKLEDTFMDNVVIWTMEGVEEPGTGSPGGQEEPCIRAQLPPPAGGRQHVPSPSPLVSPHVCESWGLQRKPRAPSSLVTASLRFLDLTS